MESSSLLLCVCIPPPAKHTTNAGCILGYPISFLYVCFASVCVCICCVRNSSHVLCTSEDVAQFAYYWI